MIIAIASIILFLAGIGLLTVKSTKHIEEFRWLARILLVLAIIGITFSAGFN